MKSTTHPSAADASAPPGLLDDESRVWLRDLRSEGRTKDQAVARLHALLLRAARFECARRRPALPHLRGNDLDDIANQAADDSLVSVLARLDDFRGASRFTTWVYKFALLEAAVKLRKRSWQGREVPLERRRGACSRARGSSRTIRPSKASCCLPCSKRSPTS
jgi:RNA polymerase sigma-70 factor (ECF subfamily)